MNSLAQSIVKVVSNYLGPAAEKFVNRQATFHLGQGVTLASLSESNLPELFKWIEISAKLLIDEDKVAQMMDQLKTIK